MITPAITALLDQHRAIVESRELSFDEKVGYLAAHFSIAQRGPNVEIERCVSAHLVSGALVDSYGRTFNTNYLLAIRQALTADQSRRLSEAAQRAAAREAQQKAEREAQHSIKAITDRQQQTRTDASTERKAIHNIVNGNLDLNDPIVMQNLQLHINRLANLEKRKGK